MAAGVGITLTESSCALFAELAWTPGALSQAEDRVHRIGQTAPSVDAHYVLADASVDQQMWALVARKLDVVSSVLDAGPQRQAASRQPTLLQHLNKVSTNRLVNERADHDSVEGARSGAGGVTLSGVDEVEEAFADFMLSQGQGSTDGGSELNHSTADSRLGTGGAGGSGATSDVYARAAAFSNLRSPDAGMRRGGANQQRQLTMTQMARRVKSRVGSADAGTDNSAKGTPTRPPAGIASSQASALSPDQQDRVRRNREAALERRRAK